MAHSGGENYFLSFHPDKDDIDVDNAGAQWGSVGDEVDIHDDVE